MANRLLGKSDNPFGTITELQRDYLDCLAAVRNRIVHGSDASIIAYKHKLRDVYRIGSAPDPDEFLNAIDYRSTSPAKREQRLFGIAQIVKQAIGTSSR